MKRQLTGPFHKNIGGPYEWLYDQAFREFLQTYTVNLRAWKKEHLETATDLETFPSSCFYFRDFSGDVRVRKFLSFCKQHLFALLLFLLAAFLYSSFVYTSEQVLSETFTFPLVFFSSFLSLLFLLLLQQLCGKREARTFSLQGILLFVLGALFLFATPFFGYYLSSGIFLLVTTLFLKIQPRLLCIVLPACWLLFSYFVFEKILSVPLPVMSLGGL